MPRVRGAPLAAWCIAAVVTASAWGGFACTVPDTYCIGRGTKTSYAGTLTVQAALDGGASNGTQGDGEMLFTDYDQNCVYDQEEFLVEVNECQVWVKLEPEASHPDASDLLPGNVESGQACTLHTSSGRALVSIASGRLTFADGTPSFSLDAAIGSLDGKPASGSVHLDFAAISGQ